jgi:hypothetical protein
VTAFTVAGLALIGWAAHVARIAAIRHRQLRVDPHPGRVVEDEEVGW